MEILSRTPARTRRLHRAHEQAVLRDQPRGQRGLHPQWLQVTYSLKALGQRNPVCPDCGLAGHLYATMLLGLDTMVRVGPLGKFGPREYLPPHIAEDTETVSIHCTACTRYHEPQVYLAPKFWYSAEEIAQRVLRGEEIRW